jgi:hypothetical protein
MTTSAVHDETPARPDPVPGEVTEEPGDDPWEGIPAELLAADAPYDPDTAGGCG